MSKEKYSILVVDDEKDAVDMIQEHFAEKGYDVLVAFGGKEAIDKFEKYRPQIVFLDILMGDVYGIEVLKKIKVIDPTVKVIMVTAVDELETKLGADAELCDAYVTKPIELDKLDKALEAKKREIENTCRIMVIEDDEEFANMVVGGLKEKFKADYVIANTGENAVEMFKENPFNILIVDLGLPGISGWKVITGSMKMNPHVDIIIISGEHRKDIIEKAIGNGVVLVMEKPFRWAVLRGYVDMMMKRRGFFTPN